MSQLTPVDHLAFLSSYDDDRRGEYVRAIVRVLAVEHELAARGEVCFGWRITPREETGEAADAVPIKTGYVQKLVNEGVVRKVASGDDYTRYRLDAPGEELVAEIRASAEHLDMDHRNMLKDLPYW